MRTTKRLIMRTDDTKLHYKSNALLYHAASYSIAEKTEDYARNAMWRVPSHYVAPIQRWKYAAISPLPEDEQLFLNTNEK